MRKIERKRVRADDLVMSPSGPGGNRYEAVCGVTFQAILRRLTLIPKDGFYIYGKLSVPECTGRNASETRVVVFHKLRQMNAPK
jgi:hypothetical protein